MKKLLIMVSALTAAVFSSAKADVTYLVLQVYMLHQVVTFLMVLRIVDLLQVHYS